MLKVKKIVLFAICFLFFMIIRSSINAETEIVMDLKSESKLKTGQTVDIILYIDEMNNQIRAPSIDSMIGKLEYNTDIFEMITEEQVDKLVGLNNWNMFIFNPESRKFIVTNQAQTVENEDILKITLKVKDNINLNYFMEYEREIRISGINISENETGEKEIYDASIILDIDDEEKEEYYIRSDIYSVLANERYIELVRPETTIENFIRNIETNGTITIENTEIAKIEAIKRNKSEFIGTGAILRVNFYGTIYEYEIIVLGDINGEGRISITDFTMLARELVKSEGEEFFNRTQKKAADLNFDGKASISDYTEFSRIVTQIKNIEEYYKYFKRLE